MTRMCEVYANWPRSYPADRWSPSLDAQYRELKAAGVSAPAAFWSSPPTRDVDDETLAALEAWQHEGLARIVDPAGVEYPDRLPFFAQHGGEMLAELSVSRTEARYIAFGQIGEEAAAKLAGLQYVSDGVHFRRARIVDLGEGQRYVEVTHAELFELSATDAPSMPDTTLLVGKPGVHWLSDEITGGHGDE